jgi:hypothetical protein
VILTSLFMTESTGNRAIEARIRFGHKCLV